MKGTSRILAGLLALLGFAGCENDRTPPEYGVPSADFTVKGIVVNRATGKPVKDIHVSYIKAEQVTVRAGAATADNRDSRSGITGDDGSFSITQNMFPDRETPVPIYIQDLDGTANGGFFGLDSLAADFSEAVPGGRPDRWYEGEYTVTVTVALNEKEMEE
jgi:putative lipoprotein (rSAM/lipoprotein system)